MSAQLSRCVAVYSRHFVASRVNAPAVVVAVVFTLDHFVTTERTIAWAKSLLDRVSQRCARTHQLPPRADVSPLFSVAGDSRNATVDIKRRSHRTIRTEPE